MADTDKQFSQTIPLAPKQNMYLHAIDRDNGKDGYIDQQAYEDYIESTLTPPDDYVDFPQYPYTGVGNPYIVPFQNPNNDEYGGITIVELQKRFVNAAYPIGTIYENELDSRNPFEYFGVGTWVAWGQGKSVIGIGTGTDINGVTKTVARYDTGGEYVHTLTEDEIAKHDHPVNVSPNSHKHTYPIYSPTDTVYEAEKAGSGRSGAWTEGETASVYLNVSVSDQVSGDQSHNNVQPYVSTYRWKRVN